MDLLSVDLPGLKKVCSGKVREIFDLGDSLLFVATDRISAFDCILPNAIPHKGEVLNQISAFWFRELDFVPNHMITAQFAEFPGTLQKFHERINGRAMIVKKAQPLPVECVVRGYLAGSGWKEYQGSGRICGEKLPRELRRADKLPQPLFTPSTKADTGHDINISWDECQQRLGKKIAGQAREWSLRLYERGRDFAAERGIIVADTKFEFGLMSGDLILIDECLTPDSSRFWPTERYAPGANPPSYDKQPVRDYLESLSWNKTPPAPSLPDDVVTQTTEKYREVFAKITGEPLMQWTS